MYTQCPECETTFKLGAEDLRLANGKVRCGDCNHVFNALEFLAEEVEEELVTESAADSSWSSSESNPSGDLEPDLDEYESSAYLEEEEDGPILYIGDEDSAEEAHDESPDEASDHEPDDEPETEGFDETDVEFDDEVWDQVPGVITDPVDEASAEEIPREDEFPASEFTEQNTDEDDTEQSAADDIGEQPEAGNEPETEPDVDDLEFNVPEDKWGNFFGPLPKGQTAAVWQPPKLDDAETEDGADDAWEELTGDEEDTEVGVEATTDDDDAPSWKDTDTETSNGGLYLIGGITLAVLLVMQLVHYNRDRLAASPSWGNNIRAIYGTFGSALYPDWSIDDYEIRGSEAVAGETGRDVLDIRAQIANTGTRATGLPHLRIMLKDRWSNPVAAQDFSAAEYATNAPAGGLLQPGDMVGAHVSIQDPGSGAQGFELELCLPRRDTGLECTGQPFK